MATNKNADEYANARIGIYLPASTNNTLGDGDLTGQCVSLVKWFLAEMTTVPNPATARGHAKDYGNTLVSQKHAYEVSAGERQQGDLVVWPQDGGGYGHIGVLLSGDRVFEQNVGLVGTPSRVVYGQTVYASRIDPLVASWRKGTPRYYRINTYEGGRKLVNEDDLNHIYAYGPLRRNRGADEGEDVYLGKSAAFVLADHRNSTEGKAKQAAIDAAFAEAAKVPELQKQLAAKPKEVIVEKPAEVIKEVIKEVPVEIVKEVEVIKEVVKSDEDRSLGDLLSAAFQKLFKIK